jgi:CRISPR-associated protein Cas1
VKHHLNTLFVTTQGAYLAKEGQAVLVRVEKQTKLRVPIHTLGGIICFGRVGVSPSLMGLCGQSGVAISFLTERGQFLARVNGFTSGNVLLRRQQYRMADSVSASVKIASAMVTAKIANTRSVLLRNARDYPDNPARMAIESAARKMLDNIAATQVRDNLDSLRGIEGDAANLYFDVFDSLINSQKESFAFKGRSRRPPLDPVNALLSFLYAMLAHDCRCASEAAGLDPAVGFLHRDRPGRPGLALDLMEEFRPFLADRLTLSLLNRRQVDAAGFITDPASGAVRMDDSTRKAVMIAWQKRKQEEIIHPFLGEKVSVGLLPHLQARLLARHLRGDLDAYPPFLWK